MLSLLKRIVTVLQNFLFPPYCIGCHRVGTYFCVECKRAISPITRHLCPYCMRPSYCGITHYRCQRRNGLSGAYHCFLYDGLVRKALFRTKYNLRYRLLTLFLDEYSAEILGGLRAFTAGQKCTLIPVPLHADKERKRGFNQAELIASWLSRVGSLPVEKIVVRTRNTPPQSSFRTPGERRKNISLAFDVVPKQNLNGKFFIVIDDIWTSGSTAKEIARTLKQSGSGEVFLFTIAGPYGR